MRIALGGRHAYVYTASRPLIAAQRTIVFVHGAANDHSVWALQSRWFACHGWNALAVDLPGHGRSEGDPLDSAESIAAWAVGLLDALGVAQAALVGHSMGALAVLEAAALAPERVSRLALLGAAFPLSVSPALLEAARSDEPAARALINQWSFAPARQLASNRNPGVWMLGSALRLMERCRPGVLLADLDACNRYAHGLAAAAAVRCPTLLLLGDSDLMAPARNARALAGAIASAQVETLPGCGHVPMVEQPDATLRALRRFLGS